MPIGDAVCVEPVIGAVIAEVVKETPFHSGSLPPSVSRLFFLLTYIDFFW